MRKLLVVLLVFVFLFSTLGLHLRLPLPMVYAAGYVVNWNVDFNTQVYWGEMVNQWGRQTNNVAGDAWVTDGIAYTEVGCYGGSGYNQSWGNCWLGQGATLWGGCGGYVFAPVPCTSQQWLLGASRLVYQHASWSGLTATFLNLWGTFDTPTGSKNYDKFEVVIYLSRSRNWDFWNGRRATLTIDNEGFGNRYVVQYRLPRDISSSFTVYGVDVSWLLSALQSAYNVDLSLGYISGLTIGNEAWNAQSQSAHNFLYYFAE